MQVEYKTEKGTVLFVKVPDDAFRISLDDKYGLKFKQHSIPDFCFDNVTLPKSNWQLIGLTSEVTEEQAKMMVDCVDALHDLYRDYQPSKFVNYNNALSSFTSLMQHLKVYEVNHFNPHKSNMELIQYYNNKDRTGKWVVLFKLNEKL